MELSGSDVGGGTITVEEAKPRGDGGSGGRSGGFGGRDGGRSGGGRFGGGRFGGRDGGRSGGGRGRGRGPSRPSMATPGTGIRLFIFFSCVQPLFPSNFFLNFNLTMFFVAVAGKKTTFGDD